MELVRRVRVCVFGGVAGVEHGGGVCDKTSTGNPIKTPTGRTADKAEVGQRRRESAICLGLYLLLEM